MSNIFQHCRITAYIRTNVYPFARFISVPVPSFIWIWTRMVFALKKFLVSRQDRNFIRILFVFVVVKRERERRGNCSRWLRISIPTVHGGNDFSLGVRTTHHETLEEPKIRSSFGGENSVLKSPLVPSVSFILPLSFFFLLLLLLPFPRFGPI